MTTQATTGSGFQPVADIKNGIVGTLSAFGNVAGVVPRLRMRWFWAYPFILFAAAADFVQFATSAQRARITQVMLEQRGMTGDQIQAQLAMIAKFASIGYILAPIVLLAMIAVGALLIRTAGSAMGAKTGPFGEFMSLSAASTMPLVLQIIVGVFLVRTKSMDDFQTMADLQPPFGLNMVIEHAPKMMEGLLAFFSIFEIWAIVMAALMFAGLCRTSVAKGFIATSPAWIVSALWAAAMSLFS